MMPTPHFLSRPILLAAAAVLAAPVPAQDSFKSSDYDSLGKKLSAYVDALNANKGRDKALEDISKELEKIEKRLKRDPLSLPAEMGQALWASFDYDRKGSVARGKVDTTTVAAYWDPKTKFTYSAWMPGKYDPRKAYPVILCLPDEKEKITDHLIERWTNPDLRDATILVAVPLPEDTSVWLEGISGTKETGMGNVAYVFSLVLRNLAVDYDRIYLAGHGRGVELAVAYASSFPDRFAGVIGRSGDVGAVVAENLSNLPTFFAGAGGKTTELAERLKTLGYGNCTVMAEGKESDIHSWMTGHPRVSNPTEVVLHIGSPVPKRAYWLEVRPTDGQGTAYLKAKVDRATNTIEVEGEGVPSFFVYFNDVLVDLDKPVKVVCNGTVNERTVPRSLSRTLDLVMNSRSDPGKFYVASMEFDLPAKPKPK